MIQSAEDKGDYIEVIKDGEKFRRYSKTHWEHKFLSEDYEPVMIPCFLEGDYRRFLKRQEGE